jgi:hypothetical protein
MTVITSSQWGKLEVAARPTITVRRRLATAACVTSALIAGVLAWRWALVEATTDYGPSPEALVAEPATRPVTTPVPPPIGVEATVLDVHTAPAIAPTKARPSVRSSRPRLQPKSAR